MQHHPNDLILPKARLIVMADGLSEAIRSCQRNHINVEYTMEELITRVGPEEAQARGRQYFWDGLKDLLYKYARGINASDKLHQVLLEFEHVWGNDPIQMAAHAESLKEECKKESPEQIIKWLAPIAGWAGRGSCSSKAKEETNAQTLRRLLKELGEIIEDTAYPFSDEHRKKLGTRLEGLRECEKNIHKYTEEAKRLYAVIAPDGMELK